MSSITSGSQNISVTHKTGPVKIKEIKSAGSFNEKLKQRKIEALKRHSMNQYSPKRETIQARHQEPLI